MALWAYPALKNFPKSERHTLVADIKKSLYRCLDLIIHAQKAKRKTKWLYDLDVELEVLTAKVRLSAELQFLPAKKYRVWSEQLTEIGRMVGGWIKATT